jgi:hypothetical protein
MRLLGDTEINQLVGAGNIHIMDFTLTVVAERAIEQ